MHLKLRKITWRDKTRQGSDYTIVKKIICSLDVGRLWKERSAIGIPKVC